VDTKIISSACDTQVLMLEQQQVLLPDILTGFQPKRQYKQ